MRISDWSSDVCSSDLEAAALDDLLGRLVAARAAMAGPGRKPLLLKVAPDLDTEQRAAVAETALRHGIDGLVVGNTTIARHGVAEIGRASCRERVGQYV